MKRFCILTNDLQFAAANKHQERKMQVSKFLPKQKDFLNEMRSLKVPIIHLQLIVSENDPRSQGIEDEQKFTKGSKGAEILREVWEESDLIVEKPKDSGFFNTNLDDLLKKLNITDVIITGMQTQICVQTTAADAYFRGYKVLVPSDGVVSTRPDDTNRALEWMAGYCAKVMTLKEILEFVKSENSL